MSHPLQPLPNRSIKARPSVRSASVDCSVAMSMNIHVRKVACGLCAMLVALPTAITAQERCTPTADSLLESGWRAYRADSTGRAAERFGQAHRLCPQNLDATTGL